MQTLLPIFIDVVLPVLLAVGVGAALQRFKPLDINTLSRLTLWVLVPAFLFLRVYESKLTWTAIGHVAWAATLPVIAVGLLMFAVLRRTQLPKAVIATLILAAVVPNAGNFAIPLAQLLHEPKDSGAVILSAPGIVNSEGVPIQALCVLLSNLLLWCVGYTIVALIKGDGWRGALGYFRLPMIYAIIAAFLFRDFTVLKIMLTAIVVGGIGVHVLVGLDLAAWEIKAADLLPLAIGSVLFGIGMAVYGYCPGTGVAAAATGRLDALTGLAGMLAGGVAYGLSHAWLRSNLFGKADWGKVRLDGLTGIPAAAWLLMLALLLLGLALLFRRIEAARAAGEPARTVDRG